MTLNQITIENILERYSVLPDELLIILEDPNTKKIVETICQKNNIFKEEWISIIKKLVDYVLMGFIHYCDLGPEINAELNFSNSKLGNDIASEIEAKIFNPIKNILEKNYSPIIPQKEEIFQKKEEFDVINLQKESKIEDKSPKKELQPEPKPQPPKKQEAVPLEEIIIEKNKISTPNIQQEERSSLSFTSSASIPQKTIPKPPQKEIEQFSRQTTSNQNIQIKQTEKELINLQNKTDVPLPVFIHKEETISPIKKGVEIKPPEIKISDIKPTSPPPKPVQIEIGVQNNKTQKTDLDVKVVNYYESTINQPEDSSDINKIDQDLYIPSPKPNITPPPPPKI